MTKEKSYRKRSNNEQGRAISKANQVRDALATITEHNGYEMTLTASMKHKEAFDLFVKMMKQHCPDAKKDAIQTMYFKGNLYAYGSNEAAQKSLTLLKTKTEKQLGLVRVSVKARVDEAISDTNPMTLTVFNLILTDRHDTPKYFAEALVHLGMVFVKASRVKEQGFPTTTYKIKAKWAEGEPEASVLAARTSLMARCFKAKSTLTVNHIEYGCTFLNCCLFCNVTGHEINSCQKYFDHLKLVAMPPTTTGDRIEESE